nr:hypothetical protein [Pararhodobacter sp. CCB-MM2]
MKLRAVVMDHAGVAVMDVVRMLMSMVMIGLTVIMSMCMICRPVIVSMDMVVGVAVMVVVSMVMIVRRVIVSMDMIGRPMIVTHRPSGPVGPGFRGKGARGAVDTGTKALEHALQNMVLADQQVVLMDLARGVPVPDVPRQARQIPGDHQDGFLGCNDPNIAPVLKFKTPVFIEVCHRRQIDHEPRPLLTAQPLPAHQPGVVIHHHVEIRGGRRLGQKADGGGQIGMVSHSGILVNAEFTLAEHPDGGK